MKPIHIKRVIDFVHQHHPEKTGKHLRSLLQADPLQFIELLNQVIAQTKNIPSSVIKFMNEITQINQTEIKEEHSMNTQQSTSQNNQAESSTIMMKLVTRIKKTFSNVAQFFSKKASTVKVISFALAAAIVAYFTSGSTLILAALATVKGEGFLGSMKQFGSNVLNIVMKLKERVLDKVSVGLMLLKGIGHLVMDKAISIKSYIVKKAKQVIRWFKGLLVIERDYKAAA
ncbi:hypothetical protein [Shewanella frigidimarina]|uniref:hypothetical protein n=1 Tax=Shewanella frigidimarina TaxID=56812 RepID=UPI003D7A2B20